MTSPFHATAMPLLLDLFCGAGGAAMGYHRAGFRVVGVDIEPQPHSPFEFVRADAMTFPLDGFDVVHASPPCQAYSSLRVINRRSPLEHPDLIAPLRERLQQSGLIFVIENVPGAPLLSPVRLCGSIFGLRVRRHRLFESNVLVLSSPCRHKEQGQPVAVYGDHPESSAPRKTPGGGGFNRARTLTEGHQAMGIDWMGWRELTQAIPPAYTEWIGRQLMAVLS